MAEYVTFKKKFSVPLFVVLLIFGFIPGIIYFIWAKTPTKICTDPEKGHGWLGRVIGAGVALATWLYWCIITEFAFTFIIPLIPSVILFVLAFLSKKVNQLMLWLNVVATVVNFIVLCAFMLFLYGIVAIFAYIVVIVACVKGFRHYNYHVKGKAPVNDEDEEDEDEDEE